MMVKVKICGLGTLADAQCAADAGADMLGFHLSKHSPHYIEPAEAAAICKTLREKLGDACPMLVGVFMNEVVSNITLLTSQVRIAAVQLSGDESNSVIKELRFPTYKSIQPMNNIMALDDIRYYSPYFQHDDRLPSIMLDPYFSGQKEGEITGQDMVDAVKETIPRLMLTGGFTPENVVDRLQALQPWAVDVNEGLDITLKEKDHDKIKAFIDAVKAI